MESTDNEAKSGQKMQDINGLHCGLALSGDPGGVAKSFNPSLTQVLSISHDIDSLIMLSDISGKLS